MCSSLHDAHRTGSRFAVVLLWLDTLVVPEFVDLWDELARWAGRRVDPVVVVIEDERDVEVLADGKEVVDVVAKLEKHQV